MDPVIVKRSEHTLSRQNISPEALKVLYGLKDAGYIAFIAGGGVRDLLLGREPKDFDVVTDATPNEVRKVFRNSRLIGRRFRLAHVFFGRDKIIATNPTKTRNEVMPTRKIRGEVSRRTSESTDILALRPGLVTKSLKPSYQKCGPARTHP